MIQVHLNGTPKQTDNDIPLFDFLKRENFNPRLIAIEFNGEILHRQFWSSQTLSSGDRLEVVTIVGGG